jgi:hypothetical protein
MHTFMTFMGENTVRRMDLVFVNYLNFEFQGIFRDFVDFGWSYWLFNFMATMSYLCLKKPIFWTLLIVMNLIYRKIMNYRKLNFKHFLSLSFFTRSVNHLSLYFFSCRSLWLTILIHIILHEVPDTIQIVLIFFRKWHRGSKCHRKKIRTFCGRCPLFGKSSSAKTTFEYYIFLPKCFCRGINHEVEKYFTFLIFII